MSVSDHAPIVLYLKVNSFVSYAHCNENLLTKPKKLNWDSKIKDRYINLINSEHCKSVCSSFLKTGIKPEQVTIDAAVKFLSDIMVETAEQADLSIKAPRNLGPPVHRRGGCRAPVKHQAKQPAWHGVDCNTAYRNMQETARFLHKDPNNPYLRGKIIKEKKLYRKLVKQQQGKFVSKMFEQLDDCKNNDPKKYMDIVKKNRDGTFDRNSNSDSDSVSPDNWQEHFSTLLGPNIEKIKNMNSMKTLPKTILRITTKSLKNL